MLKIIVILFCYFVSTNSKTVSFNKKINLNSILARSSKNLPSLCSELPNFRRGQWVLSNISNIYIVECNFNYTLTGGKTLQCISNNWVENGTGLCIKSYYFEEHCDSLSNTDTYSIKCYLNGALRSCTDPPMYSEAVYSCADGYEFVENGNKNNRRHCNKRQWKQDVPICVPICGKRNETDNRDFPWNAAIYKSANKELICAGSLINKRVVVTAARCVMNKDLKVFLPVSDFIVSLRKSYSKFDAEEDEHAQHYTIDKMYRGGFDDLMDIAILRLNKDVDFSIYIHPICVEWYFPISYDGLDVLLPGWDFHHSKFKAENDSVAATNQIRVYKVKYGSSRWVDGKLFDGDSKLGTGLYRRCPVSSGNGLISSQSNGRHYLRSVESHHPYQCDRLLARISVYVRYMVYPPEALFNPTASVNNKEEFCTVPVVNNGYAALELRSSSFIPGYSTLAEILPEQRIKLNASVRVRCLDGYSTNENTTLICTVESRWKTKIECTT